MTSAPGEAPRLAAAAAAWGTPAFAATLGRELPRLAGELRCVAAAR